LGASAAAHAGKHAVLFSQTDEAATFNPNHLDWVNGQIACWSWLTGFTICELTSKLWGTRSSKHDPLKQAQALLAAQLRDLGCSYSTIGQAMGDRTKPAAFVLVQKGRELRTEQVPSRPVQEDEIVRLQQVLDAFNTRPDKDEETVKQAAAYRARQRALKTIQSFNEGVP
jgi:hypothetical protein